jgi:hypothetical protein
MFELRFVEVTEPLAARESRQLERPMPRGKPSPEETFETLRATQGAASVIEQVPSLARPDLWVEMAYFDTLGVSGPAADSMDFWDADLWGFYRSSPLDESVGNDYMFFAGPSWAPSWGAPGTSSGRIVCWFSPGRGDYVIHVQLYGFGPYAGDQFEYEPEEPKVAFFIDDIPLGERVLPLHSWSDTVLYVRLVDGDHRFDIRQVPGSGSFLFRNVSVWNSPLLAPPGPAS